MSSPDERTVRSTARRAAAIGNHPSSGSFSSIVTDLLVWLIAVELAALARYDFDADKMHWEVVTVLALLLAGGHLVLGALVLLYRGRYVDRQLRRNAGRRRLGDRRFHHWPPWRFLPFTRRRFHAACRFWPGRWRSRAWRPSGSPSE